MFSMERALLNWPPALQLPVSTHLLPLCQCARNSQQMSQSNLPSQQTHKQPFSSPSTEVTTDHYLTWLQLPFSVLAQYHYANSLSINTRLIYCAGQLRSQSSANQKSYLYAYNRNHLNLLCYHIASERITQYAIVKVYLAASHSTHVSAGLHSHFY